MTFSQVPKRNILSDLPLEYKDTLFLEHNGKILNGRKMQIAFKQPLATIINISDYHVLNCVQRKLMNDMMAFNEFEND